MHPLRHNGVAIDLQGRTQSGKRVGGAPKRETLHGETPPFHHLRTEEGAEPVSVFPTPDSLFPPPGATGTLPPDEEPPRGEDGSVEEGREEEDEVVGEEEGEEEAPPAPLGLHPFRNEKPSVRARARAKRSFISSGPPYAHAPAGSHHS